MQAEPGFLFVGQFAEEIRHALSSRSVNGLFKGYRLKWCAKLFQTACWELTWHSGCVCLVQLAKNNSVWTQVRFKTKQPWHEAVKVNNICNHSKHFHWYHLKITSRFPSSPKCSFLAAVIYAQTLPCVAKQYAQRSNTGYQLSVYGVEIV